MNDLRKQWVEALRSGKYKQGKHRLRGTDETYCCLGVACDIAGLTWTEDTYSDGAPAHRYGIQQDNGYLNCSGLTKTLEDSLGVSSGTFIELNDDQGYTFDDIADYIEALPV